MPESVLGRELMQLLQRTLTKAGQLWGRIFVPVPQVLIVNHMRGSTHCRLVLIDRTDGLVVNPVPWENIDRLQQLRTEAAARVRSLSAVGREQFFYRIECVRMLERYRSKAV